MKAIGKIGVLLISFMVVASIFLFINIETYGIDGGMRFRAFQLLLIIGIPWFISYSKWANDNIWNTKTSKPTNTSYSSSEEVVEPIDDNHDILGNINLPSLSTKEENEKETLLKIEELKKQIESLENSLKEDDEDVLSLEDRQRIVDEKAAEDYRVIVFSVVGLVLLMGIIAWFAAMADN